QQKDDMVLDKDLLQSVKRNMIIYSIEGVAITAVNVPLVLIIILIKRLRTCKEFLFIAGISIGDLIYTIGFTTVSLRRFFEPEGYDTMTTTRADCVKDFAITLYSIGNGVVGEMTLFTSIDRLLATVLPIWHFRQRYWYTLTMCSIPLIISVIITSVNDYFVIKYDENDPVFYMCFDATYPGLQPFITAHRCGCVVLSALIYVVVSLMLYKKFAKHFNARTSKLNVLQRNNVVHATITMGLSTLNAFVLMLVPDILIYSKIGRSPSIYLLLNSLILNKVIFIFRKYLYQKHV
uniref:G-protein coupled receptors family 1 profile domain-containing protein n=1 Tax=Haemonchus contortus TaxID=6289 RepID=A0A912MRU5_HAECO